MSQALPSGATRTIQPCASSRSATVWSSCTYAGRRASAATASSFATASRRSSSSARARREAEIDAAIAANLGWLERQLAKAAAPTLGLDRLTLTAEQGRREARARISLIAQSEAAALGVSYARISLRDQRSRWGSCSTTGTLSFNWRLVLAPHDVLDYVVVHEICHLVEMNHGPGFWALVEKRRPAYAEAKAWLDEHGWEILAYRPPEQIAA